MSDIGSELESVGNVVDELAQDIPKLEENIERQGKQEKKDRKLGE